MKEILDIESIDVPCIATTTTTGSKNVVSIFRHKYLIYKIITFS